MGRTPRAILIVVALLLATLYPCSAVVYVRSDAAAGGNGSSWRKSFFRLQDAVDKAALTGDEVWVAAGIYAAPEGSGPCVRLKPEVRLYGGFSGRESQRARRNPMLNKTVIQGGEYQLLVSAEDRTVLDGFTITGGWTGVSCNGRVSIRNCLITGCGGRFTSGGGVSCWGGADVWIVNCRIEGNTAGAEGGGIYCEGAKVRVENSTISGNHSGSYAYNFGGGGICAVADRDTGMPAEVNVYSSTIKDNSCTSVGGGVFAQCSVVRAENCFFLGNLSDDDGGAVYAWDYSDVCLLNCIIAGNVSYASGGGLVTFWETNATLVNCTACGNAAVTGGFSMCYEDSRQDWYNTIVTGNMALYGGGAADLDYWNAEIHCSHCDIWDNGDTPFLPVTYDPIGTNGNISRDPLLADPGKWDFHISKMSPCVNSGTCVVPFLPKTDFEGDPRAWPNPKKGKHYDKIDIGADESVPGRR